MNLKVNKDNFTFADDASENERQMDKLFIPRSYCLDSSGNNISRMLLFLKCSVVYTLKTSTGEASCKSNCELFMMSTDDISKYL